MWHKTEAANGPLVGHTFPLTPAAERALAELAQLTGDSWTESVNQAVQLLAMLTKEHKAGSAVMLLTEAGTFETMDWRWSSTDSAPGGPSKSTGTSSA